MAVLLLLLLRVAMPFSYAATVGVPVQLSADVVIPIKAIDHLSYAWNVPKGTRLANKQLTFKVDAPKGRMGIPITDATLTLAVDATFIKSGQITANLALYLFGETTMATTTVDVRGKGN
jgi:hypothetical protein